MMDMMMTIIDKDEKKEKNFYYCKNMSNSFNKICIVYELAIVIESLIKTL